MVCGNCEGWGCRECELERAVAEGGEQGPTALEIENAKLKAEVERLRADLQQIEVQVSSNENEPDEVLAVIGRIARAALAGHGPVPRFVTHAGSPAVVGFDANGSEVAP